MRHIKHHLKFSCHTITFSCVAEFFPLNNDVVELVRVSLVIKIIHSSNFA